MNQQIRNLLTEYRSYDLVQADTIFYAHMPLCATIRFNYKETYVLGLPDVAISSGNCLKHFQTLYGYIMRYSNARYFS